MTTSLERVRELSVSQGLAAAIYTQATDVETEVNGLVTYDRALIKLNAKRIKALTRILYERLEPN